MNKIKKEIQELEDFLKMDMWYMDFKTKEEMNYYLMLNFRNLKHRINGIKEKPEIRIKKSLSKLRSRN